MKKMHFRLCLGFLLAVPAILLLAVLTIRVRDTRRNEADESVRQKLVEALRTRGTHWEDVVIRRAGRIHGEGSLGMLASCVRGPYRYRFSANANYGPDIIWLSVRFEDGRSGPAAPNAAPDVASFQFRNGDFQAALESTREDRRQRLNNPLSEAEEAAFAPIPALGNEFYQAVLEATR